MKFESMNLEACPSCGEKWIGWSQSATISGGLIETSNCCGAAMEIVVNWDVFSGLPEHLQALTLERIEARHEAIRLANVEAAKKWHEIDDMMRAKGLLKVSNPAGMPAPDGAHQ